MAVSDFKELVNEGAVLRAVWPLSILALKTLLSRLTLSRKCEAVKELSLNHMDFFTHPKLKPLFTKHVKQKKVHELEAMAELCAIYAKKCKTSYVVDFGAGLGHLARRLAFGHGLKVCCLEMQNSLNEEARQIDAQFMNCGKKYLAPEDFAKYTSPIHLTLKLTQSTTSEDFVRCIRNAFRLKENEEFTFGIVGLHSCGDLSTILINMFSQIPESKFLNIISCCYMKLTTGKNAEFKGYPLSSYLSNHKEETFYNLSYEAREMACHAIESYSMKLAAGQYNYLKIHAYRAAIERILVNRWPHLKHVGLKGVKYAYGLEFSEYANLALANLNIALSDKELDCDQTNVDLSSWHCVAIFHTLRLMFAPLVESILLYDRLLFLKENGYEASLKTTFDPIISPRNHVLTAIKS